MLDNADSDKVPNAQMSVVAQANKPVALDPRLVAQTQEVSSAEAIADPNTRSANAVAFKQSGIKTHLVRVIDGAKLAAHTVNQRYQKEKFIFGFDRKKQDGFIFNPHPQGLEKLKSPLDYEELEPYAVSEQTLVTSRKFGRPASTITLWEKKAEPGKPHIIYFTGKTGHIADTGPLVVPPNIKPEMLANLQGYERNAGLKFLAELAREGAGFTCVTMSGYGNNKGEPGEEHFKRDIKAFVEQWKDRPDRPPAGETIVAGYSLGTANAAIAAVELTNAGLPPSMLAIANGFSSMITRGKEFLDEFLKNPTDAKYKKYQGLDFSEETIRDRMLKHPFNTEKRITQLMPQTHLCIGYSTQDEVVDNSHSKRMVSLARSIEHPLVVQKFDNCGHLNVPPELIARNILQAYGHAKSPRGQQEVADAKAFKEVDRMTHTRDGEYLRPKSFIVEGRSWQEIADAQKPNPLAR